MEKDTKNEHITSLPTNSADEVINRRKFYKEEAKRKKKAKREEEFLTNLRKPKDTKIVLADRVVAESLLECLSNNSECRSKRNLNYPLSSKDFPELSATCLSPNIKSVSSRISKMHKRSMNKSKNIILEEFLTLEKNTKEPKSFPVQENESDRKMCSVNTDPNSATDASLSQITSLSSCQLSSVGSFRTYQESFEPKKNKKRKKKDPIVMNISDLLGNKKQPKKNNKLNMHNSRFRRGGENYYLSGNMLDSSNPRRRRGKHRENKRKKLTKLKFAIIKDRILKFKARKVPKNADNEAESAENENFNVKVEVDEYLSDLINKKLKFQKKKNESENKKTIQKETIIDKVNFGRQNELDHEKKVTVNTDGKDEHSKADNQTKKNKNTRKYTQFRKYCENAYKKDLDLSVNELIEGIVYLQDKAFARDPIKARAKRRFVTGFREVQKYLILKKIKILIIAPDLEAQESVFNKVEELKRAAALENVPCVFALNRRKLGFVSKKSVPVSVFGILSYEGLEYRVETVKKHLKDAQAAKLKSECQIECDGNSNNKFSDTLLKLLSN